MDMEGSSEQLVVRTCKERGTQEIIPMSEAIRLLSDNWKEDRIPPMLNQGVKFENQYAFYELKK